MKRKQNVIDEETKAVLETCRIEDKVLYLPGQLSRELYEKVNMVITGLGGKWNKKIGGHELEYDMSEELSNIIKIGVYYDWKKDTQFYPTPLTVLRETDHFIPFDADDHITILDPSAGQGAILDYLREEFPNAELYAVEINPLHIGGLREKGYKTICKDFMEYHPDIRFDLIVMNPPFDEGIQHIMHAYDLLKNGGAVVSVIDGGIKFRQDGKYRIWNKFIKEKYYSMLDLPQGAFKSSGTGVSTVMIGLFKLNVEMRYHYYKLGENPIVEIENVPDEDYGVTTAIVDVNSFLQGEKWFPCGSGNDICLTKEMRCRITTLLSDSELHRNAA